MTSREYSQAAPQPFFLKAPDAKTRASPPLFCVWRAPRNENAARVWVLVPPFFEEEKSARRTLSEWARRLQNRDEFSLLVTPRGHGDSGGDVRSATLSDWRTDILRACAEAKRRAPSAEIALCGVRLGATLCVLAARESGARELHLIEPVVAGRVLVRDLMQRKKLRAMITREESGASAGSENAARVLADDVEDIDGWALSQSLRDELGALDLLQSSLPNATGAGASARIVQVSGRSELSPPLQKLAAHLNAKTRVVVARPFWTQNEEAHDETVFAALLEK